MIEIIVLDGQVLNPGDLDWSILEELGNLKVYERSDADQIKERAINAEYIIVNKSKIDADIIDQLPKLKCICVTATGYNNVDTAYARIKNIDVVNVVGYGAKAVAQHVFALILHYTNHVALHNTSVKEGQWQNSEEWCYWNFPLMELSNKTLGIIGYGDIGKEVAKIGLAFNMNVKVAEREGIQLIDENISICSLEEIYNSSDFLTLHVPLTNETELIINEYSLMLMKSSAMLVNTGRGGLINESDLYKALTNGTIRYAALDVLTNEPPLEDNKLIQLDNCLITPHNAWVAVESRQRLIDVTFENLKCHIEGHPQNVVN